MRTSGGEVFWVLEGVLSEAGEHVLQALALDKVGGRRLVDMKQAEERVLEREERDEGSICVAREGGHYEARERIEQVVVCGRDDGEEDEGGVEEEEQPAARHVRVGAEGHADDEGVAEVEGGHRGQRVAESVRGPDGAGAVLVHRVDEAVCSGEEARGHAGPEGENGKGEQVGKRHGAAHGRVDAEWLGVVEAGQEGDRCWYVDERVYPGPPVNLHVFFQVIPRTSSGQ